MPTTLRTTWPGTPCRGAVVPDREASIDRRQGQDWRSFRRPSREMRRVARRRRPERVPSLRHASRWDRAQRRRPPEASKRSRDRAASWDGPERRRQKRHYRIDRAAAPACWCVPRALAQCAVAHIAAQADDAVHVAPPRRQRVDVSARLLTASRAGAPHALRRSTRTSSLPGRPDRRRSCVRANSG